MLLLRSTFLLSQAISCFRRGKEKVGRYFLFWAMLSSCSKQVSARGGHTPSGAPREREGSKGRAGAHARDAGKQPKAGRHLLAEPPPSAHIDTSGETFFFRKDGPNRWSKEAAEGLPRGEGRRQSPCSGPRRRKRLGDRAPI